MSKQLDLTIIILNYNTLFWLKKLLGSLKKYYLNNTKFNVKVTIVDNNSTDDSVSVISKSYHWVELIKSEENLGFAAGNNLALKDIKSRYIMLLNSDVELTGTSNLDELISYMDKNRKVAVVTPRVSLDSGELDLASHRGEVTPWSGITHFSGLEKLFPHSKSFGKYHQTYKDLTQIHSIDACSGAAMMVRSSAIEKVGLLDERFFMYAEDLDWCKRFRDNHFQIIFYPFSEVIHHKYKSGIESKTRSTSLLIKRYFYNTMLLYYDKHHARHYPGFFRTLLRVFLFIKKGGN